MKTGMYYLRSRAAADAIKFTVDTSILKVKMINMCDLLIYLFPPFYTLVIGSHRKRLNQWTVTMKSKWLRLFALWKTEKSAWLVEVRVDLRKNYWEVLYVLRPDGTFCRSGFTVACLWHLLDNVKEGLSNGSQFSAPGVCPLSNEKASNMVFLYCISLLLKGVLPSNAPFNFCSYAWPNVVCSVLLVFDYGVCAPV